MPRHDPRGLGEGRVKEKYTTHRWLIVHRIEDILSRTACQPESERAPIRLQQQICVEGIRVDDYEVSRLVFRWRGCLDSFGHPLNTAIEV